MATTPINWNQVTYGQIKESGYQNLSAWRAAYQAGQAPAPTQTITKTTTQQITPTQPPTPTTTGTAQYGTITVNTSQRQPGWSVVAPGYTTTSTGQVVPTNQTTTTTTQPVVRPTTPTERISQSAQNLAITQAITQRKPYEEIYIKPLQLDVKTTAPIREPIIKPQTTFIPGKGIVETGKLLPTETIQEQQISRAKEFIAAVATKKGTPQVKTAIDAYIKTTYAQPSPEKKAYESNILSGRQTILAIIEGQKEGLTQTDLTLAAFEGKTPIEKVIDVKTKKLEPLGTNLEAIQQKMKNIETQAQQNAVEITPEGKLVLNEQDYDKYTTEINAAKAQEEIALKNYNEQVKEINQLVKKTEVLPGKESKLLGSEQKELSEAISGLSESELAAISKYSSPEYGEPSTTFDIRESQPGFIGMSYVGNQPKTYQELVDITARGEAQRKYLLGQEYEKIAKGEAPTKVMVYGATGAAIGGVVGGLLTIPAGGVGAIPGIITGFETGIAAGGADVLATEYFYRQTGDIEKAQQIGGLIGLGVGAVGGPFEIATAKTLTKELGLAPKVISQTSKVVGREVIEPIGEKIVTKEIGSGIVTQKISQPTLRSALRLGSEKMVTKEIPVKYDAIGEIIETIPKPVEIKTITPTQYYKAFGEITEEVPTNLGAAREAYLIKQTGLRSGELSPSIKAISFSEQEAAKYSDQEFAQLALGRQKMFETFSGEMLYKKTGEAVFEGAGRRGKDIIRKISEQDVLVPKSDPYVHLYPRFTEKQIAEQVIEDAPYTALMRLEKKSPGTLADIMELQPELAAKARVGLSKKDFEAAQFMEARVGGKYVTTEKPLTEIFRTRLKFVESVPQGEYDKIIFGTTKEGIKTRTIIQRGVLAPKKELKEILGTTMGDGKKSSKEFLKNMFKEEPREKIVPQKTITTATTKKTTQQKPADIIVQTKGQTATIQKTSEIEKQFAEAEQLAKASQIAGRGNIPILQPDITGTTSFFKSARIGIPVQMNKQTQQIYATGTETITPTKQINLLKEFESTTTAMERTFGKEIMPITRQTATQADTTLYESMLAEQQKTVQAEQELNQLMQMQLTIQETQQITGIGLTPITTTTTGFVPPPVFPPIFGSGGETQKGSGYTQLRPTTRTRRAKPVFQIKSDYFRKFVTGEKDLPATTENIARIKKIWATKGSLFGIIPTKQQLQTNNKKKWLI